MATDDYNADDLTDLERRLSSWEPTTEGLDSDALLFAAGRASARPGLGRFVWPALYGRASRGRVGVGNLPGHGTV